MLNVFSLFLSYFFFFFSYLMLHLIFTWLVCYFLFCLIIAAPLLPVSHMRNKQHLLRFSSSSSSSYTIFPNLIVDENKKAHKQIEKILLCMNELLLLLALFSFSSFYLTFQQKLSHSHSFFFCWKNKQEREQSTLSKLLCIIMIIYFFLLFFLYFV